LVKKSLGPAEAMPNSLRHSLFAETLMAALPEESVSSARHYIVETGRYVP
jgi:hypothetical protein